MSISVMLKPASGSCNLQCAYCFYHSLSKDRKQENMGMMSKETALRVIDQSFSFAKGGDVFFTFQGGEPLLAGIDFFEFFFEEASKRQSECSSLHFCVQTNGTLIDENWCALFKKYGCLVGVSLDGDKKLNSYRLYPDGSSSFDDVMNGISLLKKYNVTFNVLAVLTARSARSVRNSYRFFKSQGLHYLQYIPCLKPFSGDYDSSIYMDNDDYAYFLEHGFKLYFNDNMRGNSVSVRSFDNYVRLFRGQNAEQCGMNGFCSTQFVVEADGSTYPCDFYCTDQWLLGNINTSSFEEMYVDKKSVEFLKESFAVDKKCKTCDYFTVCRAGGCKRNRASENYCEAYTSFFKSSMHLLRQMR